MKSEFLDYFKAIGMTEPIQRRIETVYEYTNKLCPGEEFEDVAVNEYVDEEGTRTYTAVRFYSDKRVVMIKDILGGDDFSVRGLKQDIVFIRVEAKDYDFKKAIEKSRLHVFVQYSFFENAFAALNGSGGNCDHLMAIYRKYYLPHLML